jgi:YVTN family beta-propeller protein
MTATTSRQIYLPLVIGGNATTTITTDGRATWSTPITVSPRDGTVWVVNPDAGSVTAVDPERHTPITEIAVGQEPWSLAIAPDGYMLYVVDRAGGTLIIVNTQTYAVHAALPVGAEPTAVALSPTGANAYVVVHATGTLVTVDTARQQMIQQTPLDHAPYALAVSDDGDGDDSDEQIYVTHLTAFQQPGGQEATDDGRVGRISLLRTQTLTVVDQIDLLPDQHGFPNLLTGITLAGGRAWVPQVRAAPDLPNGLSTQVFAAVSSLDLIAGQEDRAAFLPLNDQEIFGSPVNDPVAAIPSPDGTTLYVVLAGSNLVEVVDIANPAQPRLVRFLPTGQNPRGMALSANGRMGYVMDYLSRSVTILDLERLERVATVPVTNETLDPTVLQGKILFHTAAEPRMSKVSWVSCASCHIDGGTDSVTWIFPDGPRQTPPLWNAGQTLPWHWSAALDELQDVEDTIHTIQFGLGLAPGSDPPILGMPNAGRSDDLDALAAFLERGIRPPVVPAPPDPLDQGRALFVSHGCATCHGGPHWTSSAMPGAAGTLDPDGNGMVDALLHDVGTLNPRDIRGATGFDVPSLLGVGLTPPYLHDGSMPTLEALLVSGHPDPTGADHDLSDTELTALVTFVRSIGPETEIVEPR